MAIGDYSYLVSSQAAGRIQPQQWQAPDGSWVILIGAALAGRDEDIVVGDYYGSKQTIDMTAVRLIRFAVKLRQSADSATVGFRARLLLNDVERWALEPAAGATTDYAMRIVNTTTITGLVSMEFRLEAVTP